MSMGSNVEACLRQRKEQQKQLIREAETGEIKRDTRPNAAYEFSGALLAEYSARTDIFRNSIIAHMIMCNHQAGTVDIQELKRD